MSDAYQDDDYEGDGDSPVAPPPKQSGFSKSTVEAIKSQILGSREGPTEGPFSQEAVDAVKSAVLFGDTPQRGPSGRFSKGSSGNPKGRPKRAPEPVPSPPMPLDPASLGAIALRHLSRTITVRTEDGEVAMALSEGIVAKVVQDSAKGNTGQTRTLFTLAGKAEVIVASHKRDVFRYWSEMRLRAITLWTEAKQAGRPAPDFVHPDDIQLNADGIVSIVGPTAPDEITAMRATYRRVEYHLINIAYQQWLRRRWERLHRRPAPAGDLFAEVEFAVEQRELPARLRLTPAKMARRKEQYDALAGRALHARLRAEAAKFGLPVPPREVRTPVIIPQDALDAAEEDGVLGRKFLEAWLAGTKGSSADI